MVKVHTSNLHNPISIATKNTDPPIIINIITIIIVIVMILIMIVQKYIARHMVVAKRHLDG